ncbi:MAG: Gfo/Idh/MocA family oxidoreductase [Planctomycetes bacterium]|nr:Gfo/Idh/MocA family oxidoreductase [Planctomycetota bacterium]
MDKITWNRRSFLRTSAAAAVGLGIVGQSRAFGANDKIRAAVIGLKGRGGSHIDGFLDQKGVEVAALCDIDEGVLNGRLADVEKRTGQKPAACADVRKLLEDKSIDVVGIATPNHWHSLASIWAIQAGKDVYVEKPCSHNVWEGRKLVEAARKHQRVVQHGTQIRSHKAIREAIAKLEEGVIGEVYMAKGLCYKWRGSIGRAKEEPAPKGVHYDLWLGPAPVRPFTRNRFHYNWHWHWDYGNGDIGNQGVHQMDVARWGLGVGLPKKAQSMGGHFLFDDDQETPNTQVATFWYPEEKKMLVFEVRHWITNGENLTDGGTGAVGNIFYGSEGIMIMPSYSSYKVLLGRKLEPGPSGSSGGDHFANFIEAVRARDPAKLNAEIEEGHKSAVLCHLANVAYRAGRTIEFDPVTETCPGDKEANALLTREYREPFAIKDLA